MIGRKDVEAAWSLITDILEGCAHSSLPPFDYASGTWGPREADKLFDGVVGSWRRL